MRDLTPKEKLNEIYSLRGAKALGDYKNTNGNTVGGDYEDADAELRSILTDLFQDLYHAFPTQELMSILQDAHDKYRDECTDAIMEERENRG